MKLRLQSQLLFGPAQLTYAGQTATLANVLVDTGSAGTIIAADKMLEIGLMPQPEDTIREINGVGGTELVFIKQVDQLNFGELHVEKFDIEVGAMNYGFAIDGIIGLDFLMQTQALLDIANFEIRRINQ